MSVVGPLAVRSGSANTGRGGGSAQARGENARGKRQGFPRCSSECAAQVIFGIGVTAREAGASESQHGLDLADRETAAQQALGDPQIGDAPIGGREARRNLQALQPAGIDADSGGWRERAVEQSGWRRHKGRWTVVWETRLCGLKQRGGVGGELRLSVYEFDPRGVTAELAVHGFLVGETSQPSEMTSLGAGAVCAVQMRQVSRDGGSQQGFERRGTDTNPSLQMVRAGAKDDTRLMPVGAHRVDDAVLGAIEIDQDIASVSISCERAEEDVVAFAIAQPQKSEHTAMCELEGGPNVLTRERPSRAAMNQTKLIIVAGHGHHLPAHSLQSDEESAIHDRDSSIGVRSLPLKGEVLTLHKRGSFHFALTRHCQALTGQAA